MTKPVARSRGEEKDSLLQKYMQLQREWNAYQRSAPPRLQRRKPVSRAPAAAALATPEGIIELLDSAPKRLLSSLQGDESSPPEVWGVRSVDWDAEEILIERMTAATKGGGLTERCLMDALECARDDADYAGEPPKDEASSACPSSVTIRDKEGSAARSSSCGCSCSACSSCSSSTSDVDHVGTHHRSSSFCLEREGGKKVVGARSGHGGVAGDDRERRLPCMAWLAVVLMVFALGLIFLMELIGEQDGGCLIPT